MYPVGMPRNTFGRSCWGHARSWWLAAALVLLPLSAHAASANVEVQVRCPQLEALPETRSELEARALVELAVRRQSSGVLVVSCDADGAELIWTSGGQVAHSRVPAQADARLLVDALVAALWNLTAPPPSTPPRSTPPAAPAPAALPHRLAVGLFADARLELWPRAPNALPGCDVGLSLLGDRFVVAAFGHYGAALDDVAGLRSSMLGGGAALDVRPLALRPLALGVAIRGQRFGVEPPAALTPREGSTWTLATALRLRFFQRWQTFTLALGPELVVYPVRARVLIGDREALSGPVVAGAFTLELGYLLRR